MDTSQAALLFSRGDEKIMEGVKQVTADVTLGVLDRFVEANKATAFTVTLPLAGEVEPGARFRVRNIGVGDVTIAYPGTSGLDPDDKIMSEADDAIISESDGMYWYAVDEILTETRVIKSTITSITNAQIKLLFSVPITLVSAPGAGKALIFHGAEVFLDHGGTDFVADANEDFQIQYDGAVAVSELALQADLIEAAADVSYWMNPKQSVIKANEELEAANITAEVATGNGTMKVKCFYSILTLLT